MHLTLAFIGYVSDDIRDAAGRAVREAAPMARPIGCRLGEIGAFPTPVRPRVVWVGLAEGAAGVESTAHAVRERLRDAGVPFDDKPPVAHLTVARVRDGVTAATRAQLAETLRSARAAPLEFELSEVVLFESRLARSGPTYVPLERAPLR